MNNLLYITASYDETLTKTAELISKKDRDIDKPIIVFTPEKNTMLLESQITEHLGGYFNIRVFSFGKYLKYNKTVEKVLTREGAVMVIRKILADNQEKLKCFRVFSTSIAENLYDTIALLKSSKVTKEDIENAIEKTEGLLNSKLCDLLTVYDEYGKQLEGKYKDESDMLSLVPEIINADKNIANTDVYLVGFESWTRQARAVVSTLMQKAKSVTAVLVGGSNEGVYTNETPTAFIRLAEELNQRVLTPESERVVSTRNEKNVLLNSLYSENAFKKESVMKTDKIELIETRSRIEEVEFVAKIIKLNVLNNGKRFREFTVALPNTEEYLDVIRKVFKEYEINYFLDEKKRFSTHPLARFILSYLEMIRKNLAQAETIEFVKNPLFFGCKDTVDKFENHVLKHNVKYNGFKRAFEKNADIESVRKLLVGSLFDYNGMMKVDHYVEKIEKLIVDFDVKNKLENTAKNLSKIDVVESDYALKAFGVLSGVLEFIKELGKGMEFDLKEFILLLKTGFDASEISIIPQVNDAVYIGGYKDCGNLEAKTLFALGLNGSVPEVKQDVAVLSDGDITKLNEIKDIIEPKVKAVNAREREIFATSLSAFSDKLYLIYSIEGRNGQSIKKSDALMYLEKIFELKKKSYKMDFETDDENKIANRFLSKHQAEKEFAVETGLYMDGLINNYDGASAFYYATNESDTDVTGKEILNSDNVDFAQKIDGVEDAIAKEFVSASALETYYACPFKCLLDYGMRLKDREVGEIQPRDSGNFIHELIESYTLKYIEGKINDIKTSREVTKEIIDELLLKEEYSRFLDDLTNSNAMDRLKIESIRVTDDLFKQLHDTSFKVLGAEVGFGFEDSKYDAIHLKTKKGNVKVRGKVDRVDTFDKYYRVIDYKTGSSDMSDAELYVGKKMQVYLYLNAFYSKDSNPSGTYYFKIDDNYVKDDDKSTQLTGKTVGTKEIIMASDTSIIEKDKSSIIGLSIADGEKPKNKSKQATYDAILNRMNYAKIIAEKGVDYIQEGFFPASPYTSGNASTCDYCEYKAICSYEKDVSGISRKEPTKTDASIVFDLGGTEDE